MDKLRHVPSLQGMQALIVVADTGSFTQAASILCLTQSAVSRKIQQLEQHFGVAHKERLKELTDAAAPRRTEQARRILRLRRLRRGMPGDWRDPQQNALACALATARHGVAEVLESNRAERIAKALEVGPAALDGATRLALLSDPVALARLHSRVWAEQNAAWLDVWRASKANDPHSPLLPLHPEHQPQASLANA